MKKLILSSIFALVFFCSCEKVVLTDALTETPTAMSFSTDVVPVLTSCNQCHTHGWTTASTPSVFYASLSSQGYVNTTSYTSSSLYTKLNSGHPGTSSISQANTDKIINWMKEGSKNN